MIKKCRRQKDWKEKTLTRKAHSYRKDFKRKAFIIKENSCHNILVRSLYIHTRIESSHVKHMHYKYNLQILNLEDVHYVINMENLSKSPCK
jgi:hypothetical protein